MMQIFKQFLGVCLKLILFWVLLFDFQRIIFSIHNLENFSGVSFFEWLSTLFYSMRLDISTAAYLSALPLMIYLFWFFKPSGITKRLFRFIVFSEVLVCIMIQTGEVNAYPEWGHKLTGRVFMHLANPDEVVRTADYTMVFWFILYGVLEFVFALKMYRWLHKDNFEANNAGTLNTVLTGTSTYLGVMCGLFVVARGGVQPIPININSAYFSNNHVVNDLSVNSVYYFGNSYLLFRQGDIDAYMPDMTEEKSNSIATELYDYPKKHDNIFLQEQRPNVVFIVLESWAAEAIGALSDTKGATPNFDKLAEEGLLFTNLYSTSRTSETGNLSIFSGYPALPEISMALHPDKHRKLRSINQDLKEWGYSTHFIFSGDLKYGNIGGYLKDHDFDNVQDESDFPSGLKRGKLNYYDEDLYDLLLKRINATKGRFMHCAFTGSTHSPYDHPKKKNQNWSGDKVDFMNSLIYADECLGNFIESCKKQDWFDNTLFVFVADHGHATPNIPEPYANDFYRVPLLFWGKPLKDSYKGKRIDKLGSQTDLPATLLYQMGGDPTPYKWSKDLMNPASPEFAFHTIIHGYGWLTAKGEMIYQMEQKKYIHNTFPEDEFKGELEKGQAFILSLYNEFKNL